MKMPCIAELEMFVPTAAARTLCSRAIGTVAVMNVVAFLSFSEEGHPDEQSLMKLRIQLNC